MDPRPRGPRTCVCPKLASAAVRSRHAVCQANDLARVKGRLSHVSIAPTLLLRYQIHVVDCSVDACMPDATAYGRRHLVVNGVRADHRKHDY